MFKCSQYYPFLNLSQTRGKDAISCVKKEINLKGISIYDFYDVSKRMLDDPLFNKYLKRLLFARISVASIKFETWIIPGRCADLNVELKNIFGSNNLMLSLLYLDAQSRY